MTAPITPPPFPGDLLRPPMPPQPPTLPSVPAGKPRNRVTFWVALRSEQPDALLDATLDWWPKPHWKLTNGHVDGDVVKLVLVYEGRGGNIDDGRRRLETFSNRTGHEFTIERLEQHGHPVRLPD